MNGGKNEEHIITLLNKSDGEFSSQKGKGTKRTATTNCILLLTVPDKVLAHLLLMQI